MERTEVTEKRIGFQRELVTPLDKERNADFRVGTLISGAIVSNNLDILSGGGRLYDVAQSNVVRLRVLNAEIYNNEAGWLELEFRDGNWLGGRVMGPYKLDGRQGKYLEEQSVAGRYFTSSIFVAILSGWTGQPLSNDGVKVNISFLEEPRDLLE